MPAAGAPASPEPALVASGVSKRFGRRRALRDVSLTAAPGELVALVGPNGAGKTTLLSILAGIQRADAGEVGPDPRSIGWVPQQAALYGKLTVAENLALFARLERVEDPAAAVEEMLDLTGLRERAGDPAAELSGGNRQRLNIAIGLLGRQRVLLLDEPTAALDPRQRGRVWEFVLGLAARETTVLYSTHDLREAARHADRVVVLADGEELFEGVPDALVDAVERAGAAREDFEGAFVEFLRRRGH
jgi:ABC-2 type transport system ATP-binding protein